MRKVGLAVIAILCLSFVACATNSGVSVSESRYNYAMVTEPVVVPLDEKGKAIFMGSGFQPGQEVRLLFKTPDGVVADIGYALDPQPVANDRGAWSTEWSYGRFVQKKLVSEGVYAVEVADTNYNVLATAPVYFRAN
jgi:hypothetical protein